MEFRKRYGTSGPYEILSILRLPYVELLTADSLLLLLLLLPPPPLVLLLLLLLLLLVFIYYFINFKEQRSKFQAKTHKDVKQAAQVRKIRQNKCNTTGRS